MSSGAAVAAQPRGQKRRRVASTRSNGGLEGASEVARASGSMQTAPEAQLGAERRVMSPSLLAPKEAVPQQVDGDGTAEAKDSARSATSPYFAGSAPLAPLAGPAESASQAGPSKKAKASASRKEVKNTGAPFASTEVGDCDQLGAPGPSTKHDSGLEAYRAAQKSKEDQLRAEREHQEELAETQRKHEEERAGMQKEMTRVQGEIAFKNSTILTQTDTIDAVKQALMCNVCFEVLSNPHILAPCGHTACADCLLEWFKSPNSLMYPVDQGMELTQAQHAQRTKCCFTCRTQVLGRPVPNYAVKHLLDAVRPHLDVEAVADRPAAGVGGPAPDIWDEVFRASEQQARRWFHDFEDGVRRCSHCGHEVADGACTNCGDVFSDLESEVELGSDGGAWSDENENIDDVIDRLQRVHEEEGGSVHSDEWEEPRFRYFHRRAQSPRVRWVGNDGEDLQPTDEEDEVDEEDEEGPGYWGNDSDIDINDNRSDIVEHLSEGEASEYEREFIDDGPLPDDPDLGDGMAYGEVDDEEVEWMPNLAVEAMPPRVLDADVPFRRFYARRIVPDSGSENDHGEGVYKSDSELDVARPPQAQPRRARRGAPPAILSPEASDSDEIRDRAFRRRRLHANRMTIDDSGDDEY